MLMSKFNATLLDQNWAKVMPHQRMPVDASHLLVFLVEARYDKDKTRYLVEGFRQVFHLRLNQPIHQIVKDRHANSRMVKGNKMALANPQVVEEKLTKGLNDSALHVAFFLAYVISPLGLWDKKVPGKFRVIQDLSAPFEGVSINACIPTAEEMVIYNKADTAIQLIQRARPGLYWPKQM